MTVGRNLLSCMFVEFDQATNSKVVLIGNIMIPWISEIKHLTIRLDWGRFQFCRETESVEGALSLIRQFVFSQIHYTSRMFVSLQWISQTQSTLVKIFKHTNQSHVVFLVIQIDAYLNPGVFTPLFCLCSSCLLLFTHWMKGIFTNGFTLLF